MVAWDASTADTAHPSAILDLETVNRPRIVGYFPDSEILVEVADQIVQRDPGGHLQVLDSGWPRGGHHDSTGYRAHRGSDAGS
jgi:hypothetical protein